MKHSSMIDIIVGVFVVIGLAALFFGNQVGNVESKKEKGGYAVKAAFTNIGDLKVKAPVTMAGVRIGRVTDIILDKEKYDAVVELTINPYYDNLPIDSSVSILTAGLLGSKYLGLEPGAEEDYLKEGDEIEITQSAVVLENIISSFLSSGAAIKK